MGYLAYAAGFATGTYVGMLIENRLALGTLIIRAIVAGETDDIIRSLSDAGYGVTIFDAQGATGPVKVIDTVINRKELDDIVRRLRANNPNVFYIIEEARATNLGIFHRLPSHQLLQSLGIKGKG